MSNDAKYEYKSVQAVRGLESRALAKAQQEGGWELIDQTQGTLRTTLKFRRLKPESTLSTWLVAFRAFSPRKRAVITGAGATVVALAAVGIGFSSSHEMRDGSAQDGPDQTSAPAPSLQEVATPSPAAAPSETTTDNITVDNTPEFAAIMKVGDYCDASIARFASKYKGRSIEFDGSIANMQKHGSYQTRYDILLGPGDGGTKSVLGPALKYEDVNMFDLKLTGEKIPDYVGENDKFRFVAEVGEYGAKSCLFSLKPVSTSPR
ncbi:DUF4839 domain-containing protein [Paenarthrobacter sp. NPDC089316]|uniref:DUF4839 domain-containing protein n=1 Tax=unclassified Paenarthrobacter TaxID=2634190 RepID=UPI003416F502